MSEEIETPPTETPPAVEPPVPAPPGPIEPPAEPPPVEAPDEDDDDVVPPGAGVMGVTLRDESATTDKVGTRENVELVLRGPDGKVKQRELVSNLITTVGRDSIMAQLLATPGVATPTHMAIGTGAAAPAAGDTALGTELDRNALTSKTRSTNVVTMVGDWAAGDGTGAITEAGIFNAATTGTLYSRATFSVINKGASDTLSITWTYTLTVS